VLLLVWQPFSLSLTTAGRLENLSLRGPGFAAVLVARLFAAALGIAAGLSLLQRKPGAVTIARASLIVSAAVDIVVYATPWYPNNRPPGDATLILVGSLAARGLARVSGPSNGLSRSTSRNHRSSLPRPTEMHLILVHHGDAVGPDVDPSVPLGKGGSLSRAGVQRGRTRVKPTVIWHSGKLRAKQTAEAFWRGCNPFAEFSATRDLQPEDSPDWMRDRLRAEPRDVLIAGHYPHLPGLLAKLIPDSRAFPKNGGVALVSELVNVHRDHCVVDDRSGPLDVSRIGG
jgi:phosphohistidine phosphatase